MASKHVVAYNPITERLEIVQVGDNYLFKEPASFLSPVTLADTINGRTVQADGAKLDLLTVTQPVDLDALESSVAAVTAAVVLKGTWDASTLLFPASVKAGESWICSVAGVVDGIQFNVNDRVVALVDGAPNNIYAGNWHKLDYTNEVLSVAGKTGAVTLLEADITDLQNYLIATDIDSIAKISGLVGVTLIENSDPRLTDARTPTAHTHPANEITGVPINREYTFAARSASFGTYYLGGFYKAPAADANLTQAATSVNLGSVNNSYAANAFMVFGAGSTDGTNITLTVSGTSVTEAGVRTPADSEVLYTGTVAALTANDYLETTKKWVGQVTYTLTSDGVNFTCDFNYGFVQYNDFDLQNVTLIDFEFVGLANASDSGFKLEVIHHKSTGWTYSAAAFVPGPAPLWDLATDHGAEDELVAGEPFAYKRTGLSQAVAGATGEGTLIRVTTSVNNSVSYMNVHLAGQL